MLTPGRGSTPSAGGGEHHKALQPGRDPKGASGWPSEAKGWGFSPFAVSTWGGLGSSAKAVLLEVTKRLTADLQVWPKAQALEDIRQGLSVTLMRQIARQLSAKGRVEDTFLAL